MALLRALRAALDNLYRIAGYTGAVFLVLILFFVAVQMVARWSGEIFVGAPDFTGYCMAAASFLALPYTLNAGTHIRVNLLLNALGDRRKWLDIWCWIIASFLSCSFAYYAAKLTYQSYIFNDISQGQDAWPIWIPQMSMAVGTIILAICTLDNLITILFTGKDNIRPIRTDQLAG
ncbi:MAG: TRAP transporter small permease subunit [Parvularculales bacterium]